jgi:hypothetical protein
MEIYKSLDKAQFMNAANCLGAGAYGKAYRAFKHENGVKEEFVVKMVPVNRENTRFCREVFLMKQLRERTDRCVT